MINVAGLVGAVDFLLVLMSCSFDCPSYKFDSAPGIVILISYFKWLLGVLVQVPYIITSFDGSLLVFDVYGNTV